MTSLLNVANLSKSFIQHQGFFRKKEVTAFAPLSFDLERGQTLAIVGESGSGKSTLAKVLTGVMKPSTGHIRIDGVNHSVQQHEKRCKQIRMIFQDPNTSLNPRARIGRILEAPLSLNNTELTPEQTQQRIADTLKKVGLLPEHEAFYPIMLSSSQKQRVALARALILDPKIIVADEVLATLDVSVRSQIINLILQVQKERGISFIMVAHNIGIVRHISDKILVMHEGQMVEYGDTLQVLNDPQHIVTKRILLNQKVQIRK